MALFEKRTNTEEEAVVKIEEEEWIWVNGYKGTEKNMKCRGYQFTLRDPYSIPDGEEIEKCSNGFHLCKELSDVFVYYDIGNDHRFFEVNALVRKSDLEEYGKRSHYSRNDKLVAKSIVFVRELEVDEILQAKFDSSRSSWDGCELIKDLSKWTEEQKKYALSNGIHNAMVDVGIDVLVSLGYSRPFSKMTIASGAFSVAAAVGSQQDLSMDMKAMFIYDRIMKSREEQIFRDRERRERLGRPMRF